MKIRKIVVTFFGIMQEGIGITAISFAYMLYHNFLDVQVSLNMPEQHVPFYLLLLFIFGFISIISGFFLIHERIESR
jgi:hypothetical protein